LAHVHTYLTLLAAQFLGGLSGGLLLSLVSYDRPVLLPPQDNILGAFIDEVFFSFMFMTVIYCIKSSKHNFTNDSMLGGLTVGITLAGCVLYGGKVSGACYNPSVGFTLNFWATITRSDTSYMRYLFIYLSAPTLGGLIAGFLVRFYIDSAFTPHVEPLPPRPENMPFLYDRSKAVELVTKK
jgi:glycerol uptake facilitator-like aquaporin